MYKQRAIVAEMQFIGETGVVMYVDSKYDAVNNMRLLLSMLMCNK